MVEAVMLWNEPNNLSHWNFEMDPGWSIFAAWSIWQRTRSGGEPGLTRCSEACRQSIPAFLQNCSGTACSSHVDVVAVHGFPLDWNHWTIHEWPEKLDEIRAVTACRLGVRSGVSSSAPRRFRIRA